MKNSSKEHLGNTPKADNKSVNNSIGKYIIKGLIRTLFVGLTGAIMIWNKKKEGALVLKQKEKEYDLRNKKAVELKQSLKDVDNPAVKANVEIAAPLSYNQMTSRPLDKVSGWLIPGYAKKGQISGCVACADIGKSIFMIDSALAAAKGERPTFLPEGAPKADKMDVVFYRLEERAGEMRERYGDGSVFPANFGWITSGDLETQTFDGLIADIAKRAEDFKRDTAIFADPLSKFDNWEIPKFITAMEKVQVKCAAKGVVVSVFFSAHTEEAKPWKPLTTDMVRGGDNVIQKVGALVGIHRERSGKGFRFLQTLKVPKGEAAKDYVDVIRFEGRREELPDSYTHLVHHCQNKESEALPLRTKAEKKDEAAEPEKPKKPAKLAGKHEEIHAMIASGKKAPEIARHFKVSPQAIYDVLKGKR